MSDYICMVLLGTCATITAISVLELLKWKRMCELAESRLGEPYILDPGDRVIIGSTEFISFDDAQAVTQAVRDFQSERVPSLLLSHPFKIIGVEKRAVAPRDSGVHVTYVDEPEQS